MLQYRLPAGVRIFHKSYGKEKRKKYYNHYDSAPRDKFIGSFPEQPVRLFGMHVHGALSQQCVEIVAVIHFISGFFFHITGQVQVGF